MSERHPTHAVFAYGTLEFAEIVELVTGVRFEGEPALLRDHARYRLRNVSYPGIVPEPGARTTGTLYRGVDPVTIARLDAYESPLYVRESLTIETRRGGVEAFVWVVASGRRHHLVPETWSREAFETNELADYLRRLGGA